MLEVRGFCRDSATRSFASMGEGAVIFDFSVFSTCRNQRCFLRLQAPPPLSMQKIPWQQLQADNWIQSIHFATSNAVDASLRELTFECSRAPWTCIHEECFRIWPVFRFMTIYGPVNVVKNIQEPNRLAVAAEALMRVSCMDLNFTTAIVDSKTWPEATSFSRWLFSLISNYSWCLRPCLTNLIKEFQML